MDFLILMDRSQVFQLDPSGDEALRLAKQVRRDALRTGGTERVREEARRHFALPAAEPGYARALGSPLYVPNRSASN
jgi:hypothetical protein